MGDNVANSPKINYVRVLLARFCFATSKYPRLRQNLAGLTVATGGLSLGHALGWSSPALSSIKNGGHFDNINQTDLSLIGSLLTVGAFFGSLVAGYCVGKVGRKNTLLLSAIPMGLGWLLLATADQKSELFFGRFFTGFSVGSIAVAGPVYLSEILEPQLRGRLGSLFFISAKLGILFAFFVGSFLPFNRLAATCAPFALLFAIAVAFLPESPRYLLTIGETKEATNALSWFRGATETCPKPQVFAEIAEMSEEIERKRGEATNFLFLRLLTLQPFLIGITLMFFNQFSGGNVFGFYTVSIFEQTGSGIDSYWSAVIVGVCQTLAVIFTCLYVDTLGRRVMLIGSFTLMLLSLSTLAAFFHFKLEYELVSQGFTWIPLVTLVVYNAAYNGGVGELAWIVMSEILPGNMIGPASGFTSAFNWVMAFITTRYFGDFNEALGQENTFFLIALLCGMGALFTYFLVPETNQKSLTKIQRDNFDTRNDGVNSYNMSP